MTKAREPWVITPHSITSPEGGPRRNPPRPTQYQEPGYLEKFDSSTLFYDVFWCGDRILAVGPPAGTLIDEVRAARIQSADGRTRRFAIDRGLDRVGRFWADPPSHSRGSPIGVSSRLTDVPVTVGGDLAHAFAGRRVVMTVSKDNDLEWIRDWGAWYADRHGADALVVYDNNTSAYPAERLWETLADIPGIDVAAVVDWSFKYGPVTRLQRFWDSDYAQRGALEHARWRLLRLAAGFLNADIDELVIDHGGVSVFDAAEAAPSSALELTGRYTYPDPSVPTDIRPRHSDSYWVKTFPPEMPSAPKWCAIPARLPRTAQLSVHNVRGVRMVQAEGIRFAHLLSISTDWYGGRGAFHVVPEQYEIDNELRELHAASAHIEDPHRRVTRSLTSRIRYLPQGALGVAWRLKLRTRRR